MNPLNWFKTRFRKLPRLEKAELQLSITEASSPGIEYYVFVLLSCTIATLGLLIDSGPVIIGAMLLAPLMSPIIGIGMSTATGEGNLLRTSFFALVRGAMLAILLAAVITLINSYLPFATTSSLTNEILSRTRPTPIDLVIALAGGLGGAYALSKPNLSAALPGVAISTALMPPLCVVGIGLASYRLDLAGGAFLLFATNASAIAFAGGLVFFFIGFSPGLTPYNVNNHKKRVPGSIIISALLTIGLLLPLTLISLQTFQTVRENKIINQIVDDGLLEKSNAVLVASDFDHQPDLISIDITIRTEDRLDRLEVNAMHRELEEAFDIPVELVISQIIIERLSPDDTGNE